MLLNITDDDLSALLLALVAYEAAIVEGTSLIEPHSHLRAEVTSLRERMERRQHFESRRRQRGDGDIPLSAVAAFDLTAGHLDSCDCACCTVVRHL
jgi:hypothetical protein